MFELLHVTPWNRFPLVIHWLTQVWIAATSPARPTLIATMNERVIYLFVRSTISSSTGARHHRAT
jgi:hypothetical protein